ncbi:MAG: PAS domain-containing protein [Candidatus Zixiibacteriota bacterium]
MKKDNENTKKSKPQASSPIDSSIIGSLILDSVEFAVLILESDFNIAWHNGYFPEWLAANDLNSDDLLMKNASDIFPFWDDVLLPICIKSLRLKQSTSFDSRILINNIAHVLKGHILAEFQNGTQKLTIIFYDITEWIKSSETLHESEEKYKLLMENVTAAISLFNYDGELLFVNNIGALALGRPPDELIGLSQWDIFPPEIANRQVADIRRVMKTGKGEVIEAETMVNNQRKDFSANLQPYRNNFGNIAAVLVIASDITERKTAEEELRKSEEKYRLLVDNIQVLIAIIDYDGRFIYINDFGASLQNRTPEEIIGKTLSEILPKKIVEERLPNIRKVIDTGQEKRTEIHLNMKGTDSWYESILQPYHDAGGNIAGAMVISTDISERKKAVMDLQQAHEELERRVDERTKELAETNEQLHIERQALNQKNMALKEVLDQIEDGKVHMAKQIQANVNKILMPILDNLQDKPPESIKAYLKIIKDTLSDIAAPFANHLENEYSCLSPREVEICTLIKNGLSCKQIALSLSISPQTT